MARSREERDFEAQLGEFLPGPPRLLHKGTPKPAPAAPQRQVAAQSQPPGPTAPDLAAELAARDAAIEALRVQLANAQGELSVAHASVDAATRRAQLAESALVTAQTQAREADAERRAQARRVTELQQQLLAVQKNWAGADRRGLPAARGLQGNEPQLALRLFIDAHGAQAIEAVLDRDPTAFARLLERLVLSCGAGPCTPRHPDTLVLRVDRGRCEVCAGSDSRQAYSGFREAVRGAGFDRCTVVGGSPAYREMLRELERTLSDGLEFRYVEDVAPRADQRARQVRGLVVIWGATAVDHAATSHYRDAGDKVLEIAHRGISGMLRRATAELQRNRR